MCVCVCEREKRRRRRLFPLHSLSSLLPCLLEKQGPSPCSFLSGLGPELSPSWPPGYCLQQRNGSEERKSPEAFFPPIVLRSIKTIKTFFLQRRWRLTRQLPLPLPLPLPATQPPLPPSSRTPRPPSTTGSCASGGSRRRSGKEICFLLFFPFSLSLRPRYQLFSPPKKKREKKGCPPPR